MGEFQDNRDSRLSGDSVVPADTHHIQSPRVTVEQLERQEAGPVSTGELFDIARAEGVTVEHLLNLRKAGVESSSALSNQEIKDALKAVEAPDAQRLRALVSAQDRADLDCETISLIVSTAATTSDPLTLRHSIIALAAKDLSAARVMAESRARDITSPVAVEALDVLYQMTPGQAARVAYDTLRESPNNETNPSYIAILRRYFDVEPTDNEGASRTAPGDKTRSQELMKRVASIINSDEGDPQLIQRPGYYMRTLAEASRSFFSATDTAQRRQALLRFGPGTPAIGEFIAWSGLRDPAPLIRRASLFLLVQREHPSAIEACEQRMRSDSDPEVERWATSLSNGIRERIKESDSSIRELRVDSESRIARAREHAESRITTEKELAESRIATERELSESRIASAREHAESRIAILRGLSESRIPRQSTSAESRIRKIAEDTASRIRKISEDAASRIRKIEEDSALRIRKITENSESRIRQITENTDSTIQRMREHADSLATKYGSTYRTHRRE